MRLSELAKPTEHKLLGQDVEVGELQYNSRKVKAGDEVTVTKGDDGLKFLSAEVIKN